MCVQYGGKIFETVYSTSLLGVVYLMRTLANCICLACSDVILCVFVVLCVYCCS